LCFNVAMGQLTAAVAALCSTALTLIFIKPSYQRAKPILDAEPETLGALEDPGSLQGGISVNQVSYAYPKTMGMALNSVSIQVNPGEFVAVVGESGCGKSTLLKMMLGFYKPLSGSVLYDRKDLSRLNPIKVRQQVGVVIQNGDLVQGDIFFNIAGSDETATEEDVWKAARLARVEEDIRNMPMQLKTFVPHGGVTFSGGQCQRIMLARALFRNPKIVFLDEATSNLDNASQAGVMDSLKQMQASRFVIAHRLSTIENADRIYVMSKGQLIEQGTYLELMAAKGHFFKLASRQSI
jgi:ABC-type bacteriocin/lantibiotic exporter with double-glycine peptidase domain